MTNQHLFKKQPVTTRHGCAVARTANRTTTSPSRTPPCAGSALSGNAFSAREGMRLPRMTSKQNQSAGYAGQEACQFAHFERKYILHLGIIYLTP
jgi:hypothetical protein